MFRWRFVVKALISVLFVVIGVMHLVNPEPFTNLVPAFFPLRLASIYLTGVLEIVLAVLLWTRWEQSAGAWSAIYLVFVLPFNIYGWTLPSGQPNYLTSPNYPWQRIPTQLVFAVLVYLATGNAPSRAK